MRREKVVLKRAADAERGRRGGQGPHGTPEGARPGRPAITVAAGVTEVETQRRWSDTAEFRTTPPRLGRHSAVALYVHQNAERLAPSPRRAAWYPKPASTFADALARLRQHLWFERIVTSTEGVDVTKPLPSAVQGSPGDRLLRPMTAATPRSDNAEWAKSRHVF
jgi:hypothetical protein